MLLPIFPFTTVDASVGPLKLSITMLLIILISARILATVLPGEGADAMHFVVEPFAFEAAVIAPDVDAFASNIILNKSADKARTVNPLEHADAAFLAILINPLKDGAIGPDFCSKSILFIIGPEADVFWAAYALECAKSVSSIINPLAVVCVSINMN